MYVVKIAFSTMQSISKVVPDHELGATVRQAWALGATAVCAEAVEDE